MRFSLVRVVRALFLGLVILSCAPERALSPTLTPGGLRADVSAAATTSSSTVVISQIYGGGGNAGATLKNDFIELFNRSSETVSLADWSVQYASSAGTTWQVTSLSGSLAPGGYFLVQEAAGTGGTTSLPTPDASGSIAMSLSSGKVALVRNTTPLSCGSATSPCTSAAIADLVGFGTSASAFEGSGPTPRNLSNTTAAFRKDHGCTDTDENASDFAVDPPTAPQPPPAPRNRLTAAAPCGLIIPPGPVTGVTISPAASTMFLGTPKQFTALGTDANGRTSPTTFTWTSSDPRVVAFNDPNVGLASVPGGQGTVTITATSANGVPGHTTVFVTERVAFSVSISVNTPRQAPVGYTKPAFPTVRDADNAVISPPPKLDWSSTDPFIATVDTLGYITGVTPGAVTITATAANGVFGSTGFTVIPGDAPTTAIYRNHLEFGTPTDNTPDDEHPLVRRQSVGSYNKNRGGPNWVSWNINASHFGDAPRCDCFSADQTLPPGFYHVVDFDYRNSGYDRGHVVQSESRTTTDQENASTFLLTNILPQGAQNNQGPWSGFENYLNDRARGVGESKKEIYVIAGGLYSPDPGTLKNEGKVAIPDYTWKVAVIMPAGKGLADVQIASDLEVIAVRMPNLTTPGVPASSIGIREHKWELYNATVDEIEAQSGYDVLNGLLDPIERATESGVKPIAAALSVNPQRININGQGNGQVIVTVFGNSTIDAAAIDLESVRIGTIGIDTNGNDGFKSSVRDENKDGISDLIVHFNRDDLINDGRLTIGTTRLVLYADLSDGRQIEALGAVSVGSNAPKR